MTIYLLEGADGAGKTTLANQLASLAQNEVRMLHFGPPTSDDVWQTYGVPIVKTFSSFVGDIIIDRAHISEYVYGPILRGHIAGKRSQYRRLEEMLDSLGTKRLYVAPGWKTIQQRFAERGDDLIDYTQLHTIHQSYHRLLGNNPKWFRVDAAGQRVFEMLTS